MSDGSEDNFGKKKALKVETILSMVTNHFVTQESKEAFKFYEISEDVFVPVIIKNKKAEIEHDIKTMTRIVKLVPKFKPMLERHYKDLEILCLTEKNAKSICKSLLYQSSMHYKDKIKTVAFKSDPCVAFHRLDFDPSSELQPCPQWDLLLSNFTNAPAIMMFVGSLFDVNSDRSQYLWLYGKGGNGKSTIAKVLSKALGNFVRFEQAPSNEDKYWTYGLLGKRLIVLDDCNKYSFVKGGLFKSLTGSSKVRVERKFGDPNDADLDCKFMFTSNEKPTVSNDPADQRRIIFSSAKNQEVFVYDKDFAARLKDELSQFLSNCILLYSQHCADGRPIPTDNSEALELADEFEEDMAAWVESHYEYDNEGTVLIADFLTNLSQSASVRNISKKRIYDYLERQNVKKDRTNRGRVLRGLKSKIYSFSASSRRDY